MPKIAPDGKVWATAARPLPFPIVVRRLAGGKRHFRCRNADDWWIALRQLSGTGPTKPDIPQRPFAPANALISLDAAIVAKGNFLQQPGKNEHRIVARAMPAIASNGARRHQAEIQSLGRLKNI
jgi:hypothetical protein